MSASEKSFTVDATATVGELNAFCLFTAVLRLSRQEKHVWGPA